MSLYHASNCFFLSKWFWKSLEQNPIKLCVFEYSLNYPVIKYKTSCDESHSLVLVTVCSALYSHSSLPHYLKGVLCLIRTVKCQYLIRSLIEECVHFSHVLSHADSDSCHVRKWCHCRGTTGPRPVDILYMQSVATQEESCAVLLFVVYITLNKTPKNPICL